MRSPLCIQRRRRWLRIGVEPFPQHAGAFVHIITASSQVPGARSQRLQQLASLKDHAQPIAALELRDEFSRG